MFNQEIFDRCATHLLRQNRKSFQTNGDCAYRGNGGLKCAIGCLIPDADYDPSIEGLLVDNPKVLCRIPGIGGWDDDTRFLLSKLQSLHDITNYEKWLGGLKYIASVYGLNTDALLPFEKDADASNT